MIAGLVEPVCVVCHDAGGASQIFAMLRHSKLAGFKAYVEGPAEHLWNDAALDGVRCETLVDALDGVATLVSGTGWASDLEHVARAEARTRGMRSIAVLDHWTGYQARFVRRGDMVLPDAIWVVDEYAMALAEQSFPTLSITQIPDYYGDEQVRRIAPLPEATNELTYLLEPIRNDWGRGEAGEFQALRYFLDKLPHLDIPQELSIRLRPHPSDPAGKYDAFLVDAGPRKIVMDCGDLAQSLSRSRLVAGCQTYALTLALRTGRTVFCSLPPWAPPCSLPHGGLIHIKSVVT